MAHQQGPWDQDRPPTTAAEALLQQALWNNSLLLTDLTPQQEADFMYARHFSHKFWDEEFTVNAN